jgi:hypothetical protein
VDNKNEQSMKTITFISAFFLSFTSFGQIKNWSLNFAITGQVVNYQGKEYKNIYPTIQTNETSINQQIRKHNRRFEYILQNRTDFKNESFQNLFPDTLKMTGIYRATLEDNLKTKSYFMKLALPLIQKVKTKEKYSKSEVMDIASKFFYCDAVRPDTTIGLHICIGINGQEMKSKKDYTLLEAICFEAIFEKMFASQGASTKYMDNFSESVEKYSKINKELAKSGLEPYLLKVRQDVYSDMKNDESLRETLFSFFDRNKDNIPFIISN